MTEAQSVSTELPRASNIRDFVGNEALVRQNGLRSSSAPRTCTECSAGFV
jgi:hypothetical protein